MPLPVPDEAQPLLGMMERDVTPRVKFPNGNRVAPQAYDLRLFRSLDDPARGVLVVKMTVEFEFQNGTSQGASGVPLEWARGEADSWLALAKDQIIHAWSNQHPIVIQGRVPGFPTIIDVLIELDARIVTVGPRTPWTTRTANKHWQVKVTKTDVPRWSKAKIVDAERKGVALDSLDVVPLTDGTHWQRAVVHEFGHMLGLRDEYPGEPTSTTHHASDQASIMNHGETVRPRHYAPFAEWLTTRHPTIPWVFHLAGKLDAPKFFVWDGGTQLVDLQNAQLE